MLTGWKRLVNRRHSSYAATVDGRTVAGPHSPTEATVDYGLPEINLGDVDVSGLVTDEDFEREAARLLPEVLRAIGRHQAKQISDAMAVSLKGVVAKEQSPEARQRYIEESAIRFEQTAKEELRSEVRGSIVDRLRAARRRKD